MFKLTICWPEKNEVLVLSRENLLLWLEELQKDGSVSYEIATTGPSRESQLLPLLAETRH
jgi:hypothetical protein